MSMCNFICVELPWPQRLCWVVSLVLCRLKKRYIKETLQQKQCQWCQNAALGNKQKAVICIDYWKAHQKFGYTGSNCICYWISRIKSTSNCKSARAEVMSEKSPFWISSCYPYQINQSSHCMFMWADAFTGIKSAFCHGSLDTPELVCEYLRRIRIKG